MSEAGSGEKNIRDSFFSTKTCEGKNCRAKKTFEIEFSKGQQAHCSLKRGKSENQKSEENRGRTNSNDFCGR